MRPLPKTVPDPAANAGLGHLCAQIINIWALCGAALLCCVVVVNVASTIGSIFGTPFAGDFEITQVGVAIAVFAFLPYAQLSGANVSADIFTARAGPKTIAALTALGALMALVFALVLLARMSVGLLDQKAYGYTTTILQFPHWLAFVPILISLALLAVAAILSCIKQGRVLRS